MKENIEFNILTYICIELIHIGKSVVWLCKIRHTGNALKA
jgi:hypothetical protein